MSADTGALGTSPTSVGEAVKATQNGDLPIGTVEQILENAPSDIVHDVLEIPEWECSVKVRSLTAAQAAVVKQKGLAISDSGAGKVAFAEMEITQFQFAVEEPRFSEKDVRKLHATSGRGFQRIINWVDEQTGLDKQALEDAKADLKSEPGDEG